mgnify:CR=1 FL=1
MVALCLKSKIFVQEYFVGISFLIFFFWHFLLLTTLLVCPSLLIIFYLLAPFFSLIPFSPRRFPIGKVDLEGGFGMDPTSKSYISKLFGLLLGISNISAVAFDFGSGNCGFKLIRRII